MPDLAPLNGYSNDSTEAKLRKKMAHNTKGNWRKYRMLHSLQVKECIRIWSSKKLDIDPAEFVSPIPVGMIQFTEKAVSVCNRNFSSLPLAVKEHFDIKNAKDYANAALKVEIVWREPEKPFRDFYHLYCQECEADRLPKIWKNYAEKLPKEMSVKNLLQNWDQLGLTWMENDVAGCIIPDNPKHFCFINARHFLQRPVEHFQSVHEPREPQTKKMKTQVPMKRSFFSSVPFSSNPTSSSSSSVPSISENVGNSTEVPLQINVEQSSECKEVPETCSSSLLRSPKAGSGHPKLQPKIDEMIAPTIHINHKPSTPYGIDTWAMGSMFMNVHIGVNKNLSHAAVLDYHKVGHQMVKDYHATVTRSSKSFSALPCPPYVTLTDKNINQVHKSLYETFRWENTEKDNPYRALEKCNTFSILHDATSYWVQQFNTMFIRVVTDDCEIIPAPFSFRSVQSLTGEALCDEIIDVVSAVKQVDNNAFKRIYDEIKKSKQGGNDIAAIREKYNALCVKLQTAAQSLQIDVMTSIQNEMQELINAHPSAMKDLNSTTLDESLNQGTANSEFDDLQKPPNYFKLAIIKNVNNKDLIIVLEIDSSNIPCCQCGDGCATNLKAARLVETKIGLIATFTRCCSHSASNTIKRLCTSKTMCDINAKALYDNLKALLGHFSQSTKSTSLLNKALDMLEMNNVHTLNWGSTRMSGFMDACHKCSEIIVPLLDTIITSQIRPDETLFIGSAKGVYLLQLFNDIHDLFTNKYLHKVDSESNVLSCEGYNIAIKTTKQLSVAKTPLADHLLQSLHEDRNRNLKAVFKLKNSEHVLTLNERLTNRNKSLENLKEDLQGMKEAILQNIVENILDQNQPDSLLGLMSVFDLGSDEDYSSRVEKISQLFSIYGNNKEHNVDEKWNGYQVRIIYKKRLSCSKDDLLKQFDKAWPIMNRLSQEFSQAKEKGIQLTQYDLWKKFVQRNTIPCRHFCQLVKIMFATPLNTGWVERSYSTLEQLCPKRRAALKTQNLKTQFFMSTLRREPKDAFGYNAEIRNIGRDNFPAE